MSNRARHSSYAPPSAWSRAQTPRRGHPISATARLVLLALGTAWLGLVMRRMPEQTPGRHYWPWLVLGGLAVAGTTLGWWVHRRSGSAGRLGRWSARSQRNDGVASAWRVWRVAGRHAVRRRARVLRPSQNNLGFVERLRVPTKAYATPLARVGLLRVWSPIEDVTVRIGGPRTGKTGELACRILDAPGAVIATSTRTDLIDLTGRCRARRGPVTVFNPAGVGKLPSTITFDPLSGCTDPAIAAGRAEDLLCGTSAPAQQGDREFWSGQARRVLACLLHAAALGEAGMRDVQSWVSDPDDAAVDVRRFLRRSPEPAFEAEAQQFLKLNERTRSSICSTIMPALGWLTVSSASAAAAVGGFDVATLLAQRGTVYMLGGEDAQTAPLVTALTGHIAREARRIAAECPGGRLDPPLTLALDEAALICPIPLDSWTADMGGRNVTIHIAVQSRAQLKARWGDTGAAAILNNAATLMVFGGTRDFDDLAGYSALTGERLEQVPTWDERGLLTSTSTRRVPVLSAAQIAQLPERHVLIIRRGMPPAVGKVAAAWRRRDVRAAERRATRAVAWADARADCARWSVAFARWCADTLVPALQRLGEFGGRVRRRWAERRRDNRPYGLGRDGAR